MEWGLEGVVWPLGSSDCFVNLLACSSTRTKLQIVAPAETDRYDKDKSTSLSTLVIIFVEDIGHMFPANIECGRHAFCLRMTQILKLTFFPLCVESHLFEMVPHSDFRVCMLLCRRAASLRT